MMIDAFNNMPPREMIDCRITAFRDVLLYHGVPIESHVLYLISKTFGFHYGHVDVANNMPIWFAGNSLKPFMLNMLEGIGVDYQMHQFEDDTKDMSFIKEQLTEKKPLLALFDSRCLDPNYVYKQFNIYSPSLTVIAGLDDEAFYLSIKHKRDTVKLRAFEIDNFMKSRKNVCEPYSPDMRLYTLEVDQNYKCWLKKHLNELIKQSLIIICEEMLGKKNQQIQFKHDYTLHESACGLTGMAMLIQSMKVFMKEVKTSDLDKQIIDKIVTIKFLALREGMLQGSTSCYREEFGEALIVASKYLNNKQLKNIGKAYIKVGHQWRHLLRTLYAVQQFLPKKLAYMSEVCQQLEKIKAKETTLISDIYQLI